MPFVKGDPNINRKGRPKDGESWTGMMSAIGDRTGKTGKALKEEVLEMIYNKARDGDLRAAEMILDRMEGKAVAKIQQDVTTGGESLNAAVSFKGKGQITQLPEPDKAAGS